MRTCSRGVTGASLRPPYHEARAALFGPFVAERAAVTRDPARRDGEPEAGAGVAVVAPAPGHEGLEDPVLDLGRHTRAVVLDDQLGGAGVQARSHPHVPGATVGLAGG